MLVNNLVNEFGVKVKSCLFLSVWFCKRCRERHLLNLICCIAYAGLVTSVYIYLGILLLE